MEHKVYRMTLVVEAPAGEGDFGDLLSLVSDAAMSWRPGAPEKVFVGAMITPPTLCPTECDDDCESPCHEAHQVPWRQDHDPRTCPGVFIHPSWVDPPVRQRWEDDVSVVTTSSAAPYPNTSVTVRCVHRPTGLHTEASIERIGDDPRGTYALRQQAMAELYHKVQAAQGRQG